MVGSGAAQRFLGALFEDGVVGGLTDAELLERFVARHPVTAELAFAVLVERHGPLVQRVCRGILRDEHATDDAFQSTFLVLVKKAPSLRVRKTLAPWLQAVAYRVACEARSTTARRLKHERRLAELATEATCVENDPRAELECQLQDELAKLTERHRRPIVLCDLQGLTHEQAADLLGTPVGTVKSRLARGREQLRDRLARRGLGPSDRALPAVLASGGRGADLPIALLDRTARIAMQASECKILTAGTVPATVSILVQEVLKSMFLRRLEIAAVSITAALFLAIGVGFAAQGLLARAAQVKRPSGRQALPERIAGAKDLTGPTDLVRSVAFSRDGKSLIAASGGPGEIRLWNTHDFKPRPPLTFKGDPFAMAVAPDSQTLAVAISQGEPAERSSLIRVIALPSGETRKEWALEKGVDVWSLAFAPGGKSLVLGTGGLRDGLFFGEARIWDPASGEQHRMLKGHPNPVMSLAFSHDGRTLASASGTYGAPTGEVRLWEFATGRLLHTLTEADEAIVSVAFSPDDMTVASGGTIWREGKVVGGVVTLWNAATGEKRITLPAFPSYVHAVSFAPSEPLLATASIGPDNQAQVAFWNPATGKALKTLPPAKVAHAVTAVVCIAFSPDGQTLAAGGASGMLRLWPVNGAD
jgi:RNA polymerase sigma factor (sigma-70 family)